MASLKLHSEHKIFDFFGLEILEFSRNAPSQNSESFHQEIKVLADVFKKLLLVT